MGVAPSARCEVGISPPSARCEVGISRWVVQLAGYFGVPAGMVAAAAAASSISPSARCEGGISPGNFLFLGISPPSARCELGSLETVVFLAKTDILLRAPWFCGKNGHIFEGTVVLLAKTDVFLGAPWFCGKNGHLFLLNSTSARCEGIFCLFLSCTTYLCSLGRGLRTLLAAAAGPPDRRDLFADGSS